MEQVAFTRMADGTAEEYAFLGELEARHVEGTADRVLTHLKLLDGSVGGYQIDRLQHCLQTATLAQRDGAEEEMIVAALLDDLGDLLAPENHSEFAASVLRPYVSERTHWVVKHHGLFQGYYYFHHLGLDRDLRDRYRDHPHFAACVAFCERWDQAAFDPNYDTLPLAAFEPAVRRLFAKPRWNADWDSSS